MLKDKMIKKKKKHSLKRGGNQANLCKSLEAGLISQTHHPWNPRF